MAKKTAKKAITKATKKTKKAVKKTAKKASKKTTKASKKVVKKKTTTKKKAASKKTVKKTTKNSKLTAKELKYFKNLLLLKLAQIGGNVTEMQKEALKQSRMDASGDLSSMPIHMADIGTDNYLQEFALELVDSERKLLKEIQDALQRIEDKTYGICEKTKTPINIARLEAKPWARYCVEYARKLEMGLVREDDED